MKDWNAPYLFWIDDMLLPITPELLEHNYRSTTKTTASIEKGEFLLTNKKGLLEYNFSILLPQANIGYDIGWESIRNINAKIPGIGTIIDRVNHTANHYINRLEYYKDSQTPFTFTVSRSMTQLKNLLETCKICVLDSMKITEDAKKGSHIFRIELTIIEYRSMEIQQYSMTEAGLLPIKEKRVATTWYDMNNVQSLYNCGVQLLEREYQNKLTQVKNFMDDSTKSVKGKIVQKAMSIFSEPLINGVKKVAWVGLKVGIMSMCPLLGALL